MSTTEKLAKALLACREALKAYNLEGTWADTEAEEALAAHEADKQRESVDEREAFEAWVEREAGPGADQDNRAGWVACLNWQAGRASAQAVPADQPAVQQRTQHDADSAELRSLCQARDHARRERDSLRAELAGAMSASGHLSSLVDDLRGLLAESMRVMKALHESATPDDGPDMDAIIPAGAFRQFVDDNAKLMHLIHVSPHELPAVPAGFVLVSKSSIEALNEWAGDSQFYPNQPESKLVNPLMHRVMQETDAWLAAAPKGD
jgi:hypothetical protein